MDNQLDHPALVEQARARLKHTAAALVSRAGFDPLTVADLHFETAVAVALTAVSPATLADVFRQRADDLERLGERAHFDA